MSSSPRAPIPTPSPSPSPTAPRHGTDPSRPRRRALHRLRGLAPARRGAMRVTVAVGFAAAPRSCVRFPRGAAPRLISSRASSSSPPPPSQRPIPHSHRDTAKLRQGRGGVLATVAVALLPRHAAAYEAGGSAAVGVNWGTILPHTHAPRWQSWCG
ncbi:uncharacterized protein [Oryza sativa Japonica Group]|uniref:cDNA clone:002-174-C10, full insert sequence n=2 Tax=Oryza sativa subsp. japonica TaxID=39947 RepID=B7F3A9_ORYSJ|nr:uncharacterized protein LOC9268403 [Oryza sativa Japonica Group]BAG99106.1 unnamed protein product [Oryza sativa Japonica Group]BAH93228.1 Os05g0531700 [Oryza sativa Japonica Group]|eukprot:NP_001174500.1 Os05g0531700 [Oryza sativa Japonica Group]